MMQSMGGFGYNAPDATSFEAILGKLLKEEREKRPALINVVIDPQAGSESGSMQGHNFAKKSSH